MKIPFLLTFSFFLSVCCFAQHISAGDQKFFQNKEDSLKKYSLDIANDDDPQSKFGADSVFTRMFVKALKGHNSFYYPFDSLQTISRLYAPDSSFRIFTWQLVLDENIVSQHGAIQMRTNDGSLKLFPLIDKTKIINDIEDTISDNKSWIGAIYYKIIETQYNGHNYYTLLGYDEDNIRSNRKLIEVLTFNDNNQPVFGGHYFAFEKTFIEKPPIARYIMEYKKDASPKLNYDLDLKMIVVEHLESETGEPQKKWTLIPDGDYEGFKWEGGMWVHIDKIFNQVTPEGQEPVPAPLKDNNGNLLENKLPSP
jgi:hypothetical protein